MTDQQSFRGKVALVGLHSSPANICSSTVGTSHAETLIGIETRAERQV